MDDRPIIQPEPEKHIAERAEELWRARKAKGFTTSAKQLATLLVNEGYKREVTADVIRNWIAVWKSNDEIEVDDHKDASPEMAMATSVEIIAGARLAVSECNIRQIYRGLSALIDVTATVSAHIKRSIPSVEIKTVADVSGLVDVMDRLAKCQERMSGALSLIDGRKVSARDENGEPIEAEILASDNEPWVPPHVRDSMRQFSNLAAAK